MCLPPPSPRPYVQKGASLKDRWTSSSLVDATDDYKKAASAANAAAHRELRELCQRLAAPSSRVREGLRMSYWKNGLVN